MQWLSSLNAFIHPGGIILTNFAVAFLLLLLSRNKGFTRTLYVLLGVANVVAFLHYLIQYKLPYVVEFGNFSAPIGIVFHIGKFSLLMATIFTIIFFGLSYFYIMDREKADYYFGLLLLHYAAGLGLLFTADFFNFFVFFEIYSLTTIAYIAYTQGQKASFTSVIKFAVSASVASIFLLLSLALIYLSAHSLNMADFSNKLYAIDRGTVYTIFVLFFMGILVELKLSPLNLWVRGVYEQGQAIALGLLSAFTGLLLVVAFAKIYFLVFNGTAAKLLYIVGLVTLFYGVLSALAEKNVKSIFGLSAVAQVGLAVFLLSYFNKGVMRFGFYHIIIVALLEGVIFILLASLRMERYEIAEFQSFYYRNPKMAALLGVALLLYTGFPPSPLFWTKLGILYSLFTNGYIWGTIGLLLAFMIEIAYIFNILKEVFSDVALNYISQKLRFSGYIVGILVIVLILIGLFPGKVYMLFGNNYSDVFMRGEFIKTVLRGMLWQ